MPSMGSLHQGHLSLLELAKQSCTKQVVSIFVNPLQFNSPDDFEKYPRRLESDLELLAQAKASLVFTPPAEELYSERHQIRIEPGVLGQKHEGEFRPGHFSGVLTVVSLLLNLVEPDMAVFGEKDFQQLRLIEQLVQDLKFPVRIVRAPTIREADGLAMSSRNTRLSAKGREIAKAISRGLFAAKKSFDAGERQSAKLLEEVEKVWKEQPGLRIEYLRLVEENNLEPLPIIDRPARILTAAYVEEVRLIDNIAL